MRMESTTPFALSPASAPTWVSSGAPLLDVKDNPGSGAAWAFPFQQNCAGRYMRVLPGVRIGLAPPLVRALAEKVDANRRHFPRENTLADRFGVPGLYDVLVRVIDNQPRMRQSF